MRIPFIKILKAGNRLPYIIVRCWYPDHLADQVGKKDPAGPVGTYPVIVWTNGWGWNNNAGETTTDGYKPGLIEWALNGEYIVVAANAWSVQESDDDAWAPEGQDPTRYNFGCYQEVTELWWETFLKGSGALNQFDGPSNSECEWTYESTDGSDL